MWLVLAAKQEVEVQGVGGTYKIPLVWSDGMIGACPVFRTKKDALRYAGGKVKIVEMKERGSR